MRILFRILLILAVATIVGGAIYALANRSGSSAQASRVQKGERPGAFDSDGEFNPRTGPDRDEFGGGFFLPLGMIKNLAIISIIAVIYLGTSKWMGKRSRAISDK